MARGEIKNFMRLVVTGSFIAIAANILALID